MTAAVSKEFFPLTDTCVIGVGDPEDVIYALMRVPVIDAETCSSNR